MRLIALLAALLVCLIPPAVAGYAMWTGPGAPQGCLSCTIDGSSTVNLVSTTWTGVLTTTKTNDIIIAVVDTNSSCTSVSDSASAVTWKPVRYNANGICEYYGIASGTLSSDTISLGLSFGQASGLVFAVNGASITAPMDPNAGVPAEGTTSVTYSTTLYPDLVICFTNNNASATPGQCTGFTAIATSANNSGAGYEIVTSPQSSTVVTTPTNTGAALVDALN